MSMLNGKEIFEKVQKSVESFFEICVIERAYRSSSELSQNGVDKG
jgi:hypothetical protein